MPSSPIRGRYRSLRRRHTWDERARMQPVQTYADTEALINDPRVLACRIADNGEPLVDVRTVQSLTCDTTRKDVQELSDNPFQLRASALDRLVRAQGFLPEGYQLQVKEAWRPIWVQERLWEISFGRLRDSRPDLTDEELRPRTPDSPPRRTARRRTARAAPSTLFFSKTASRPTWDGDSTSRRRIPHRASGRRRCPPLPRNPRTDDGRGRVH